MYDMDPSAPPIAYATAVPILQPNNHVNPMDSTANGGPQTRSSSRPGLGPSQQSSYVLPSTRGSHTREVQERQIKRLKDQGYTTGLAKALSGTKLSFPLRIWVIDNSGSMQNRDGHRFVETASSKHVKIVPCTRWAEIQECVTYHIQLSALIEAPTSFRMLNNPGAAVGPQQFDVADKGTDAILNDVEMGRRIISNASPNGVTPLTRHIIEVQEAVSLMKDELIQRGQRVSLILATDGLPTNDHGQSGKYEHGLFIDALRTLEGLPMWIVIRLCTDEDEVVDFYSRLDEQLELSIDVLDDFVSEAKEIHEYNGWLNYALPLHRMREMGFQDRVFDLLDERDLTHEELRQFCQFLFGVENMDGMPDPAGDWGGFCKHVAMLNDKEAPQWNPIKKKTTPWIDMRKLDKQYGDGACISWFSLFNLMGTCHQCL